MAREWGGSGNHVPGYEAKGCDSQLDENSGKGIRERVILRWREDDQCQGLLEKALFHYFTAEVDFPLGVEL